MKVGISNATFRAYMGFVLQKNITLLSERSTFGSFLSVSRARIRFTRRQGSEMKSRPMTWRGTTQGLLANHEACRLLASPTGVPRS